MQFTETKTYHNGSGVLFKYIVALTMDKLDFCVEIWTRLSGVKLILLTASYSASMCGS